MHLSRLAPLLALVVVPFSGCFDSPPAEASQPDLPMEKTKAPANWTFVKELSLAFPATPNDPNAAPQDVTISSNATGVRVTTMFYLDQPVLVSSNLDPAGATGWSKLTVICSLGNRIVAQHVYETTIAIDPGTPAPLGAEFISMARVENVTQPLKCQSKGWGNVHAQVVVESTEGDIPVEQGTSPKSD